MMPHGNQSLPGKAFSAPIAIDGDDLSYVALQPKIRRG
jgi:hypothetical protein